ATKGKCENTCTPTCPTGGVCGGSDGCGGTCGCSGDNICVEGTCTPCTVTCTGNAATCGTALQATLSGTMSGTVYICPGLYSSTSGFTQQAGVNLYGAGSGSDQASNTILDALGTSTITTLNASSGPLTTTISGLRITGGNGTTVGGLNTLALVGPMAVDKCAIVGNTGGQYGGALFIGVTELKNSTISGNTGTASTGGPAFLLPSVQAATITNCVIDDNTGGQFGGVLGSVPIAGATLTVDAATKITNNKFTAGAGDRASGIGHPTTDSGTITVNGTTITGNTPNPQCLGVTGCSV
ncbi:MAG: hypothetical protein QM692_24860, partial [Thermomicrobiales bacterium]